MRTKSSRNNIDFEPTPVTTRYRRNENERIRTTLQLKSEGIEQELDKME